MFINIYTKNVIKDIYTIITNNICPNLQLNESMKILDIIYNSKLLDNHDHKNVNIFYRYNHEPHITRLLQKYKDKNFNKTNKPDIILIHGVCYDNNKYIITKNYEKLYTRAIKVGIFYTEQKLNNGLSLDKFKDSNDVFKMDYIIDCNKMF